MLKYKVYSDASFDAKSGLTVAAFVIFTKNEFITQKKKVMGMGTLNEAETAAVGLAMEYLLSNVGVYKDDIVEVHTDSRYARDILLDVNGYGVHASTNNYRVGNKSLITEKVKEAKLVFEKLKRKCQVTLIDTCAHANDWNANITVDRLARVTLAAIIKDLI